MTEFETLLTEEDAARLLGICKGTLRNWRCKNRGPAYVRVGSAVRYTARALREYIEIRTRRPSCVREAA
jgi:hypothetical protein